MVESNRTYIVSPFATEDDFTFYAVLTDFRYWADHEDELREWCHDHLSLKEKSFEGSVVVFKSEQEYVMFELRWG
jgi:hypothetical protein